MQAYARFGAGLGAQVVGSATRFKLYATTARSCAVRLFDGDGRVLATEPMQARGDGIFELERPRTGHGALYKFVLDERELPDPYARFLPQGVHGPAMVIEPRYTFRHEGVSRSLCQQVIYELHVGTFTPEGTYDAARKHLHELARLGITTLELMPVSAFPGQRGWGYDGVAHFACFAPYGTPDQLREFLDEAHGLGLSVLLDVVYNHFGPDGNYLSAYCPEYFSREVKNAWGDAPNLAHPAMRSYVKDNARYWLTEMGFDGLRLDATHAIVDPSPRHILEELTALVRTMEPAKVLIAEDDRNDPDKVTRVGLDGLWADDFHHQVRVTLTHERDGYYAGYRPSVEDLARTIERGWLYEGQLNPATGKPRGKPARGMHASDFVYCIQNHDQVGNRARGDRLNHDVPLEAYCMVSTLLLFLPMTPLLFMGQEWAASSPFLYFTDHEPELGEKVSAGRREEFKGFAAFADAAGRATIPDPQAKTTFERSHLHWQERELEPHARVLSLYRHLLELRRSDLVLRETARDMPRADGIDEVLVVRRCGESHERVLLANFGKEPVDVRELGLSISSAPLLTSGPALSDWKLAPLDAAIFAAPRRGDS